MPFKRPGFSKGHYFNPRASDKIQFQEVVRRDVVDVVIKREEEDGLFFHDDDNLNVCLEFGLKRPLEHFIGRNRSNGLKPRFGLDMQSCRKGDVDNYVKFALDGLEGVIFENDRNVSTLTAVRKWDNDGLCLGYTKITISKL